MMDSREILAARVSVESSMNGNTVDARPMPNQDTLQLKGSPGLSLQNHDDRSSGVPSSAAPRLLPVEGLRAYLALWVVVCHVMWVSGYEVAELAGLPKLMGLETYAIDLFIIISGFVITLSLDKQREAYWQFVVRRFFRLYPVFIALFVVAIPLSQVTLWNVTHAGQYLRPERIMYFTGMVESWWANIHWNIPLHLLMLHGVVPEVLVARAPGAFLAPAWSVSLEWQFYLVAPLAYT